MAGVDEARADAAILQAYGFDRASLNDQIFGRRQLQAFCKTFSIKANGKTAEMYEKLDEKYKVRLRCVRGTHSHAAGAGMDPVLVVNLVCIACACG